MKFFEKRKQKEALEKKQITEVHFWIDFEGLDPEELGFKRPFSKKDILSIYNMVKADPKILKRATEKYNRLMLQRSLARTNTQTQSSKKQQIENVVYEAQTFNQAQATKKRTLEEPRYYFYGVSLPYDWQGCHSILPEIPMEKQDDFWRKSWNSISLPYSHDSRFVGESVLSADIFFKNPEEYNDVVCLAFWADGGDLKDHAGRTLSCAFMVFVDRADYDNLDIKEFVERVDKDLKNDKARNIPYPQTLAKYPIIWNLKNDYSNLHCPYHFVFDKNYYFLPPKTIPYENALKTKNGQPFVGKTKTNDFPNNYPKTLQEVINEARNEKNPAFKDAARMIKVYVDDINSRRL